MAFDSVEALVEQMDRDVDDDPGHLLAPGLRQPGTEPRRRPVAAGLRGAAASPRSSVRSWRLSTLPAGLRGRGSARNQNREGTLKAASRSPTKRASSSAPTSVAGPQHDDRPDLLAEHRMGHADDRAVGHRRVLEEGGLDLDAVDVLAAPDDHVLGPVDDVDESLLVDAGHVAGVQPARG